jgi:hypothetical protein
MTFDELEHCVHEDIIAENCDPAVISAEVTKLLNGLNRENNFVVRRLAKEIARGIAIELALKDGDMVYVVGTLSAVLEPMIAWLESHGVEGRSLRRTMPINICDRVRREPHHDAPSDAAKAPGGKFSYGQVRNIVCKVAMNPRLGGEAALNVLDHEGRGAKKVSSIKPEDLEMVYEACRSLLAGESASAEAEQNPHVEQSVGNVVQLRE